MKYPPYKNKDSAGEHDDLEKQSDQIVAPDGADALVDVGCILYDGQRPDYALVLVEWQHECVVRFSVATHERSLRLVAIHNIRYKARIVGKRDAFGYRDAEVAGP